MQFKWWQLWLIGVVALGFVIALYLVAEFGRLRLVDAEEDVRRGQVQLDRVVDLYQLLMDAESGHRGFLLTGDQEFLEPLAEADARIEAVSNDLVTTYKGKDENVGKAIRQLGIVARQRLDQMHESVDTYRSGGPAAGLAMANSARRYRTMATFRELADVTRDYEHALLDRSLANWDRELQLAARLNLVTLLVGLVLAALAMAAMVRSLRQRAEAAAELARQHDELKSQYDAQAANLAELGRHVQQVQEEERARLSRGLHDELGGILLSARMDVTWMQRHKAIGSPEIAERLDRVRQVLDQGIDIKRRVVEELRPTLLDTMGLFAALRWQAEETCRRANVNCTERFPEEEPRLNRAGAITLFRVVQEALANIAKHAKASEVDIAFEVTQGEVVLTVSDDGIGARPVDLARPKAHGIAGMRHRVQVLGGQLDVSRRPGRGTQLRVRIPLENLTENPDGDGDSSGSYYVGTLRADAEPAA